MARSARDAKLETRTARLRVVPGIRHWRVVSKGIALGYRRTAAGYGTWSVRLLTVDGEHEKYILRAIGTADDTEGANGRDVLDFFQAQDRAREEAQRLKTPAYVLEGPLTVQRAADHYLEWFRKHRKSVRETEHAIRAHITPTLGSEIITELRAPQIRKWLDRVASAPARVRTSKLSKEPKYRAPAKTEHDKQDALRARKATANRILTVLKAILNKARQDEMVSLGTDETEWGKVSAFEKVDEPRIRFLQDAEATRLINACAPDLRQLVSAALLTGARFGELTALRVRDVDMRGGRVFVAHSKSGRPRHVPLNVDGVSLFKKTIAGKTGDDHVFTRPDGKPWGKNHHVRALIDACKVAKIRPAISFHDLRHTYASHLAQVGVDLLTISKLLGHADTRITERHYAHLADKTLAAAVTKLPSFGLSKTKLAVINPTRQPARAARA